MSRRLFQGLRNGVIFAAISLAAATQTAEAGWWHGSSGGSFGSFGSFGSHGGLFSRWRAHHPVAWRSHGSHGSFGGSYGSRGSWGGSHGGYVSYRSWGGSRGYSSFGSGSYGSGSHGSGSYGSVSYGSHGGSSHGGSHGSVSYGSYGSGSHGSMSYGSGPTNRYYTTPSESGRIITEGEGYWSAPQSPDGSAPAPKNEMPKPAAGGDGQATLSVEVPEDALVFVNGLPTKSTGELRRYVSRGLSDGMTYTYEIKATRQVNGRTVEETKVVDLRRGDEANVQFALQSNADVETILTLEVPSDAKVMLAGTPTMMSGPVRVFRTKSLADGQAWSDYKVVVSVERNGQTISKEQTITLDAGAAKTLSFDFSDVQIASR